MTIRILTLAFACAATVATHAQQKPSTPATNGGATKPVAAAVPGAVTPPADYVIGTDDVLSLVFWREKEMSTDVAVRPDGKITVPLLNEIQAAGLTPEQLRAKLTEAATKYLEDPSVTVIVKQINSLKVYITGQVQKPGTYPLISQTTVLQLIAMAGGLMEYADDKNILIMRTENGNALSYRFNYHEVTRRRNLKQNILLKPGDTIIVK